MKIKDLVRKTLARHKLSKAQLAELLGVNRVQISRYLGEGILPGPVPCLVLAALAEDPQEAQFWFVQSALSDRTVKLVAKALSVSEPQLLLTAEQRKVLDWWSSPGSQTEVYVRELVEKVVQMRR